jgi:2-haloacid dehalogenase
MQQEGAVSLFQVREGSLFNRTQLQELGLIWRRLKPWPDTCHGLDLLNKKYSTVALSNTFNELLKELVAHSSIPFTHTYSSDMFQSYKPNPKVYLGAAEMMGVKPEECALVAAHLSDLRGAKACGFHTIYVERPLEEKSPELRKEDIADLIIDEGQEGMITLAIRLGLGDQ